MYNVKVGYLYIFRLGFYMCVRPFEMLIQRSGADTSDQRV